MADEKDFGEYGVEDRRALMAIAKSAVEDAVNGVERLSLKPSSDRLTRLGAAFVTLKINGELRGCIGHVVARLPLYACVADVAKAAAIHDSRFPPLTAAELPRVSYEISILTPPVATSVEDVIVGRDGLIMSSGMRFGLLLPQVPVEWGWSKEEFLTATCRKAGLSADCWKKPGTEIKSFRAIVFGQSDL